MLWVNIFIRAGLDAGIPMIVNGLLPFLAVVLFLSWLRSAKRANGASLSPNASRFVLTHDALQE
jgi:hypothetical protein